MTPRPASGETGVRLQKVLAQAGLGSRRACEELIAAGRVTLDGVTVREQGVRVDPVTAVIHVDGRRIQLDETKVTLALNKPVGVVSAMSDPQGRATVGDLVAGLETRVFHVGRLDTDSEGLLLLTNDGELAHRLAHPSFEVAKTYVATVRGQLSSTAARRLRDGIVLDDGPIAADRVRPLGAAGPRSMVEIELHSGRNRIVRRMLAEVGFPVERLVRTHIGPIALGDLRPGDFRVLPAKAVGELMAAVGL